MGRIHRGIGENQIMVTLKEIAEKSGYSVSTVSNVLNGKKKASAETASQIMQVVQDTGYKPNRLAQGLRRQKTNMIAIIAEDIAQFSTPFIVEGVMKNLEKRGYRAILNNLRLYVRWQDTWYGNDEEYQSVLKPALEEILSIRVDGVIYIAGHARIIHCFPKEFPVPAVMAYGFASNPNVPSIVLNDEDAGHEAAMYLIRHGHRNIGVIAGAPDNLHTQARLQGYQRALFESGILYNNSLVHYANWTKASGYEASKLLLEQNVTAVFSMSDEMSGGLYEALHERGMQAGRDFSVVSFDNRDIAQYFIPGLTTMELPLNTIGSIASDRLCDMIEKEAKPREHEEVEVKCRLIERESVSNIG